jgi:hypothetical protein
MPWFSPLGYRWSDPKRIASVDDDDIDDEELDFVVVDEPSRKWTIKGEPKGSFETRTSSASVTRAQSSPAISYAFATNDKDDGNLAIVDLKAGRVVHEYTSRSFPGQHVGFGKLVVSPDGRSVFAEGMEHLIRYDFDGEELDFAEQSDRIAQNGQAIEISDDGAYVALPSVRAHRHQPAPRRGSLRRRNREAQGLSLRNQTLRNRPARWLA